MKKLFFILSFLLFLTSFCITASTDSSISASEDLSKHILRFHVIAASDSASDQEHKLCVRDAILAAAKPYLKGISSKEEAETVLAEHADELKKAAEETLLSLNDTNSVSCSLENLFFPMKNYGNLYFPCGYYDSFQVRIGNAEGHNWWCVMYPSLCFIDESVAVLPDESLSTLKNDLRPSTYQSLFSAKPEKPAKKVIFRFRYLTFLNQLPFF